jgi:quinohemoprotein ethanol dehydrogenase
VHSHVLTLVTTLAGLLASSAASALLSESAAPVPAPNHDEYDRPAAADWPLVGGDWNNSRYSVLAQINTENVKHVGAAWTSEKFSDGATSRSTPVVKDGLMFLTAGRHVYALDAKTGKRAWNYSTIPDDRAQDFTPTPEKMMELLNSPMGLPNGKGVGVGSGLVFVGLKDGRVIALQQKTGQFVWARQTGIDQPKKGQWAAVAPTYSNGIVFTGLSDGDHNQRGRLTALNASTGKLIWQLYSVPGPGEPGHATWPAFNDVWKFGGGGVWTNPPVDPELGLVYFTTGNPVPAYAGDWRPGTNLYTCSVLAVDIGTGKLKWYYQLVHHDVFEADLGIPIVLYDAEIGGRTRKALAVMRADGHLFQLDRVTGEPILPIEERPVPQRASQKTAPTQPFPAGGESILMSCDEWRKERIPAGFVLGCMFTPAAWPPPSPDPQNVLAPFPAAKGSLMAFSPQTGYFYAQSASMLHWPRRSQDPYFLNWVGAVPGLKSYGQLAAIDNKTGKIAWKKRMPVTHLAGSPLVTAGGLMFRSSGDGNVEAYNAKTGSLLWQFQTGTAGGGPPASYEINGEQHIALAIGPTVWAFKLGGQPSSAAPPTISTQDEEFSGPLVDTEEIETTTLHRSLIEPGARYFIDEFTFNPYRARVHAGAKVLFVNNGILRHQIVALDGSWGTGPLSAAQEAWITFDRPGEYTYICKDHPWSYGQIVVTSPPVAQDMQSSPQITPGGFAEQVRRGKVQFRKNCSVCHGEDLGGRAAAPPLLGSAFTSRWTDAAVADLLDNVRTTMPQASPGSLERQTYIDIVAFLLEANQLAPADSELKDSEKSLKEMKIGRNRTPTN